MRLVVTAPLLVSLDAIAHETSTMLDALARHRHEIPDDDRREANRRVLELREKSQELFEWISETWGMPRN